jgi:hypothetical protein
VRLPFLLYPHSTIVTLHKERVAVLADLTPLQSGQAYFRSHSYFTRSLHVAARQLRILTVNFLSLLEKNLDSLSSYLLRVGPHFNISLRTVHIRNAINLKLGLSVHNAFVYAY